MREREIKSTLIINAKQAQKVNKQTKKKKKEEDVRSSRESRNHKKKSFQKGTPPQFRPDELMSIFSFFQKINILFFVIKKGDNTRAQNTTFGEKKKKRAKYTPIATTVDDFFFT